MPTAYSHHHSRIVNAAPSSPITTTASSSVRTGLRPRPFAAMTMPPTMKPVEARPKTRPHTSTEKRVSPYGSMRAM